MEKKVDFFIVGAPKCGTTALAEYLNQVEGAFIPEIKEPHFHCVEWEGFRRIKSEKEYSYLYKNAKNKKCGDASVWYLYSERSASIIKEYNQDAKVIIMIRRPFDAAVSLHSQLLFSGREDEIDFVKAWKLQDARKRGEGVPKNAIVPEHLLYRSVYDYSEQIKRYYSAFGRDSVKVIFFEDFVDNTENIFLEVCSFLNLEYVGNLAFERVNSNRYHRYPKLMLFLMRPPQPLRYFKEFLKRNILKNKPFLRGFYKKMSVKKERNNIEGSEKENIEQEFSQVHKDMAEMFGRVPW